MPISFEKDIRPLFRDDPDVAAMKSFGMDLSVYNDVKAQADNILARLEDGSMPCDEPWPQVQIDRFRQWIAVGMAP